MLVNVPIPVPSMVLVLRSIVGFGLVLQQIPLEFMVPPPSEEIKPPLEAKVAATELIGLVVITGNPAVLN